MHCTKRYRDEAANSSIRLTFGKLWQRYLSTQSTHLFLKLHTNPFASSLNKLTTSPIAMNFTSSYTHNKSVKVKVQKCAVRTITAPSVRYCAQLLFNVPCLGCRAAHLKALFRRLELRCLVHNRIDEANLDLTSAVIVKRLEDCVSGGHNAFCSACPLGTMALMCSHSWLLAHVHCTLHALCAVGLRLSPLCLSELLMTNFLVKTH